MAQPRTIGRSTQEYKNLMAAAKLLEAVSESGYRYEVENCYFDYGQDWMWTTIIAHNDKEEGVLSSWQAVNPKQWEQIIEAKNVGHIAYAVNEIRAGKYFRG